MNFRTEKDSLGFIEVPEAALWGAQTQRALENFKISGLKPNRAFVWSMGMIKLAAAEVNLSLGLLEKELAESIIAAAKEVIDNKHQEHFIVDPFQAGAGTSHNMNLNEVIANRANQLLKQQKKKCDKAVHPNDHVNMSQSTNDTIPAAIRIGCLWRLDELLNVLKNLTVSLYEKSVEFDRIIKSGRTHLQDAVPIRLGQEFGAYAKAIENDSERIFTAGERLRRLGIGGTAVGTGLNAHKDYHSLMILKLQDITGMKFLSSGNLFESMQSLADVADYSASLNTLALTLTRISNDLRLLASGPASGLDEIRMTAFQPGSSIMPGKINPVFAEMMNMVCYHVIGSNLTVNLASAAGQLELNVMMPVIAQTIFGMVDLLINSIDVFTVKCISKLTANKEKAENWLKKSNVLVTVLNPVIGYLKAAEVSKEAAIANRTIREIILEKGYLKEEEIDKVLDLYKMTEGGILF